MCYDSRNHTHNTMQSSLVHCYFSGTVYYILNITTYNYDFPISILIFICQGFVQRSCLAIILSIVSQVLCLAVVLLIAPHKSSELYLYYTALIVRGVSPAILNLSTCATQVICAVDNEGPHY